ncbi:MAG: alpha/beta hydrolase [Candidatus Heimdallarchaeota archaeon]|nr:alpha/beta hydrolase [Candidatus Heimdallarchaeota archaeon]
MREVFLDVRDHLQLKVKIFDGGDRSVIFLPGWVVDINDIMKNLLKMEELGYTVYYIEFREKASSLFTYKPRKDDFAIDYSVEDLAKIIELLDLKNFYLYSSSYGSHIHLRYLHTNYPQPLKNVFLIPAINIKADTLAKKVIIHLPISFAGLVKLIVNSYMKWNFKNTDEPENVVKFNPNRYELDLRKIKLSALCNAKDGGLSMMDFTSTTAEIVILDATRDLLHPTNETEQFVKKLPNVQYIDMLSTNYTHQIKGAQLIDRYFRGESFSDILESLQ